MLSQFCLYISRLRKIIREADVGSYVVLCDLLRSNDTVNWGKPYCLTCRKSVVMLRHLSVIRYVILTRMMR
uniref:Uncharacterized protein n=1 Tax=Arundo donax TaxID=35708 RepID=A0A0A9HAI7_ARUDO